MSVHHKYMHFADVVERNALANPTRRSCAKRTVACVGTINDKIIIVAINMHATTCDCHLFTDTDSPNAQHAEIPVLNSQCDTLYVTYQPCINCAKQIVAKGCVRAVFYRDQDSKADTASIELLQSHGIYVSDQWLK